MGNFDQRHKIGALLLFWIPSEDAITASSARPFESIAEIYIKSRGRAVNGIGSSTARAWARAFNIGSVVLDLGCGTGIPVTKILLEAGLNVYAVDASPKLVEDFRQNFPHVPIACESVGYPLVRNSVMRVAIIISAVFGQLRQR